MSSSSSQAPPMSTAGSSSAAGPSASQPFWSSAQAANKDQISSLRRALPRFDSPALRVSRVGQLDASLLDQELESMLGAPVWKALEALRSPGRASYEQELMALLRIAVLKMSLFERGATYGASLQNLKYRNEWKHQRNGLQSTAIDSRLTSLQRTLYIILSVLPSYLHSKIRDRMLSSSWSEESLPRSWLALFDLRRNKGDLGREWKRVGWEMVSLTEKGLSVVELGNFLIFLYDGRYRTLIDRMLGMRLIYAQRSVSRNVSFEFLNRQLVWEAFTEFLLFLMPLINVHRLRLRVSKFIANNAPTSKPIALVLSLLPTSILKALNLPLRRPKSTAAIEPDIKAGAEGVRPIGVLGMLGDTICPICHAGAQALQGGGSELPDSETPSPGAGQGQDESKNTAIVGGAHEVKVPYVTNCGWSCRYCYYCIVGKLASAEEEGESHWECLRCGGQVTGAVREVVEYVPPVEDEEDEGSESDDDSTPREASMI